MQAHHSFTVRSTGGVLRVLQTQCAISEAFDPAAITADKYPPSKPFTAIWDTGATNTAITQNVVDACGLKPLSMTMVGGVHGAQLAEVYLVNVMLPNSVGVKQVRVTKGTLAVGTDVLIGMDIITLGDFAITNQCGTTVFSFCYPSQRCYDFVQEWNQMQQQHVAPGGRPGFRGYSPVRSPKSKRHK